LGATVHDLGRAAKLADDLLDCFSGLTFPPNTSTTIELRDKVRDFAAEMRAVGAAPEDVITTTKRLLRSSGFEAYDLRAVRVRCTEREQFFDDAVTWSIKGYYSLDDAWLTKPQDVRR